MKKFLAFIFFTFGVYVIGIYSAKQFIFNQPVDWIDWFLLYYLTIYFMIYFIINSKK